MLNEVLYRAANFVNILLPLAIADRLVLETLCNRANLDWYYYKKKLYKAEKAMEAWIVNSLFSSTYQYNI